MTSSTPVLAPRRVCHVIHSLRPGGAEHVLVTLAEHAADAAIQLQVLSLLPADGSPFPAQLRALGAEVACLDLATRWDPRAFAAATRIIAGWAPDVVHTHLKHADLVGAVVARRLDLPMVSTLHLIEDAPNWRRRGKRRLAATARLRTAARTICVSEAQRRWYLETFPADPAQVVTIHNGVPDVASTSPTTSLAQAAMRARLTTSVDTVVATMPAIMRAGKGHHDLLDALRRLDDQLPLVVVLAGDGPLADELAERVAADPQLSGRVRLPGYVEDMPGLLAASDLVVLPSHAEALPTALLYALAAGLPIVATNVGGIREVVTPDVGRLVAPGDIGALAQALGELASDRAARVRAGAAARRRFAAGFSADHWAQRLRSLYDEVVIAHGSTPSSSREPTTAPAATIPARRRNGLPHRTASHPTTRRMVVMLLTVLAATAIAGTMILASVERDRDVPSAMGSSVDQPTGWSGPSDGSAGERAADADGVHPPALQPVEPLDSSQLAGDVVTERTVAGDVRLATYDGGTGNGYARVQTDVDWDVSDRVSYSVRMRVPDGFVASLDGSVDLLRWDNWSLDPVTTDQGGVAVDHDGGLRLVRQRLGFDAYETLLGPYDLPTGRWVEIQVEQVLDEVDRDAENRLWLDGQLLGSSTAANTYGRPITTLRAGIVAIDAQTQERALQLHLEDLAHAELRDRTAP